MSLESSKEGRASSPVAALKAASHATHQQLEASLPWARAFASREGYGRLLRAFLSLVKGADAAVDRVLGRNGFCPCGDSRRRAEWIETDLERLAPAGSGSIPAPADFSFVDSRGAAIGVLYVLEGSALGAQVLSRELESRLGITADTGGSYLHAYGERTAEAWQAFVAWANQELSSPDLLNSAIRATLLTFDRFAQHLTDAFDAR